MLRIKKTFDHDLPLPEQATPHSAGYDLRAASDITLWPGEQELIPTGFAWEIPQGFVGLIKDRSSMARKQLITHGGVIDSDYRGDVGIIIVNDSYRTHEVKKGDRIAQMLIMRVLCEHPVLVETLSDTERGEGGYGSTGHE